MKKVSPLKKFIAITMFIAFLIAVICDISRVIFHTPIFSDNVKASITFYGVIGSAIFYIKWVFTGKLAYPINIISLNIRKE